MSSHSNNLRNISALFDIDQQWSVATGQYCGIPLVTRYNVTAKDWIAHSDLSIKLGFAIPIKNHIEGCLPSLEENEKLDEIENIIREEVCAHSIGVHVLALTTPQMKEFVFYIKLGSDIATLHNRIMEKVITHEVQCIAEKETDWSSYQKFTTF